MRLRSRRRRDALVSCAHGSRRRSPQRYRHATDQGDARGNGRSPGRDDVSARPAGVPSKARRGPSRHRGRAVRAERTMAINRAPATPSRRRGHHLEDAHCWRHDPARSPRSRACIGDLPTHTFTARRARGLHGEVSVQAHAGVAVETRTTCRRIVWVRRRSRGDADREGARPRRTPRRARLWNRPSRQDDRRPRARLRSISVCLSKGLGAPVGSVVAGAGLIRSVTGSEDARRRHAPACILASGGLHASRTTARGSPTITRTHGLAEARACEGHHRRRHRVTRTS